MVSIAALFVLAIPPPGFTVIRDDVTIGRVVWYDADGQKQVTAEKYVQIKFKIVNEADHPLRWPGFSRAKLIWGTRFVGGDLLPVSFGPGSYFKNSLPDGYMVKPAREYSLLLVFAIPKQRAPVSLLLQWHGLAPGSRITVKKTFRLPEDD
jgi:hypothetical protein